MKNTRKLFAILLTVAILAANLFIIFALPVFAEDKTCEHVDADSNGICDTCGSDMPIVEDQHTHVFVDATCTAPKTCECGATEGEATGHVDANEDNKCDVCAACISHADKNFDNKCDFCGEKHTISWGKRVLSSLKIMGIGMLGIFLVTGIIILSVYILNKLSSIEKKKTTKE